MTDGLLDLLKDFVVWLLDWVIAWVRPIADAMMNGFLDLLPEFDAGIFNPLLTGLHVVNQYVPVDYAISSILSYWAFVVFFVYLKFIWKAIPLPTG